MTAKALAIDLIRTDGGTQMRAELSQDVYLDYRDKWLTGVEFDPVVVFYDGSTYWLADGFHRFYGAREAKRASLPCDVRQGTQRDAILFATGANAAHGLRRTNADKRQAVTKLLSDEEWVSWSDNKIAEQAAVSQPFVMQIRKELITVISSPASVTADQPRVGKDGKKRKPPKRNPKAKPDREPGEDPPEQRHATPKPDPESDATPFDEPLAGIDWVLKVAVPKIQEHAILAEKALGSGKAGFTADRVSKLVKPIHEAFNGIRGVIANAQQKARRK